MRLQLFACPLFLLTLLAGPADAQGTVPTFRYTSPRGRLTLAGREPAQGGTTIIPTVVVPVALSFDAKQTGGKPFVLDAGSDVQRILRSPVYSKASFGPQGTTQYADAMMRAGFPAADSWHTLLGKPEVKQLTIEIPAGHGYVLSSKRTHTNLAMVDLEFLQRAIFRRIPRQEGKLVIAVTHNTAYYAYADATVCCSWGTHGVDSQTGNSFILASYLGAVPPLVEDRDIQPLTEQLAEFMYDPLHDPLFHGPENPAAGDQVPRWLRPFAPAGEEAGCGGSNIAARYTLLEPTDVNRRSDLPASKAWVARSGGMAWHVENVALLPWYLGNSSGNHGSTYSFPDAQVLSSPAMPCPGYVAESPGTGASQAAVAAAPRSGASNGHELIGYWTGRGPGGSILRLRDVSPQWDVIIVAFAVPDHSAPEGTMRLQVRPGLDLAQMKEDIAFLKSRGRKVLISLGGGGQYFSLDQETSIPTFVSSVSQIVREYGFDGIDLDFETPSLVLDPGDTDFRHPKTPSVVHLIAALHQLRDQLGPQFMLSLVPEGTQIPGGYPGYGGQFGSYLPLLWGVRDILSFVDVQDYNTPPLEGLDGEIYQLGSVDYDAAMTELLLRGFPPGGSSQEVFPAVPADKVAVGFLVGATTPQHVREAMQYLITGKKPPAVSYRLRQPGGYANLIGAMFWTIDADEMDQYGFSNSVGPQLHRYPAVR